MAKQQLGPTMEAVLGADISKFEKGMDRAQAKMTRTSKGMIKHWKKFGVAMAAAVGAGTAASIKAYANFDKKMTESTAIMGNMSESLRDQMEQTALQLSDKSTKSATELAESYYFLASAGLSAEQSMQSMGTVVDFATAGAFDMALATDLLTDAQTALGMSSKDNATNLANMNKLSDGLVRANTLANSSVQQFSEALTNDAAPAMQGFGADMETGLAALAAYADAGNKGNKAGGMLARALRLTAGAARDNADVWNQMGVEVKDSATGEYRNFIDIIGDMETAFEGMTKPQRDAKLEQMGFAALAQKSIVPLIGASEKMKGYEESLRSATGYTKDVAGKQLEGFSAQFTMLKNNIVNTAIMIGKSLAPAVLVVVKWIGVAVAAFRNFAMNAIVFIENIRENWAIFYAWLGANWWNVIKDMINAVITFSGNMISNMGVAIDTYFRLFIVFAGWLQKKATDLFTYLFSDEFVDSVVEGLRGAWDAFVIWIGDMANAFVDFANNAWKYFKEKFTGGDMTLADVFTDSGGRLGAFGKRTKGDWDAGKGDAGLISAMGGVMDEQQAKLKTPLEGFISSIEGAPAFKFAEELAEKLVPDESPLVVAAEDEEKKEKKKGIGLTGELGSASTFSGRTASQQFGANRVQDQQLETQKLMVEEQKKTNKIVKENTGALPVGAT